MSKLGSLGEALPGLSRFARHLRPLVRRQRWIVVASMVALVGEVLLRILQPLPLKFVIDGLLGGNGSGTISVPGLGSLSPMALLNLATVAVIVFAVLRALAAYSSTVGFALVGQRVLNEVRNNLYRHLQHLSLRYHSRARGGDLLIRVIGDVAMLREVAVTAFLPFLGNILIMAGMMIAMLWLNWKLALMIALMTPLFFILARRKGRQIHRVARGQRQHEGALANTAAESMGAIKVVQALSLGGTFNREFSQQSKKSLKEGVKGKRLMAGLERSVDVLIALATAVTLWFGALSVIRGVFTTGDLVVFLAYLKTAFKPVRDFAKYTGRLAKASAAGERVLEVLEEDLEVFDLPDAIEAPKLRGRISFEDVEFSYEAEAPVLGNVSYTLEPGQKIALVGASGSGKSTLSSLILRLYDPTSGVVKIDECDIRSWTLESLRSQISIVLQDTLLFAGTISENIAQGAPGASQDEVESAARLADADAFIRSFPESYDTLVGERGVTLSAGQRQRIAIARAAIRRAPILILDEPTTGLDEASSRAVTDALDRLTDGPTTLLVTHDMRQAAAADRVLYLADGRIVEAGTPRELIAAGGRFASMVDLAGIDPQWPMELLGHAHSC